MTNFSRVTRFQTLFYPTEMLTRVRWKMLAGLKISTKRDALLFLKIPSLKHNYITSKIVQQVV